MKQSRKARQEKQFFAGFATLREMFLPSFPNSVWERAFAKLCFASRAVTVRETGVSRTAFPNRVWERGVSRKARRVKQFFATFAPLREMYMHFFLLRRFAATG